MKVRYELEEDDYNSIHDVWLEVLKEEPTKEQMDKLATQVPEHLLGDAISWGWSDTCVRDHLYKYLQK